MTRRGQAAEARRTSGDGRGPRPGDASGQDDLLAFGWDSPAAIPDLEGIAESASRIRAVADTGFASLAIPEQFGGGDAALSAMAAAQRALAMVDASTAIALNMHSLTVGLMTDYWKRHRDTSWMLLGGLATKNVLVASAFAEPGGSSNFLRSKTVARPTRSGYDLTGTKFPCSLATTAEIFCVSAMVEGTDESIVGLCPAQTEGVAVGGEWTSIGMRGSDTRSVSFENAPLDSKLVFHRAPVSDVDELMVAGIVWFVVLVTGTYHGVMSRLFAQGLEATARRETSVGGQRQILLGRAAREIYILGSACQNLARRWEAGEMAGSRALAAAMALRASLSDTWERTIAALTPVLGAKLFSAGDPSADLRLDGLAVHHHPPNLLACDEGVGALALGRSVSFDTTG